MTGNVFFLNFNKIVDFSTSPIACSVPASYSIQYKKSGIIASSCFCSIDPNYFLFGLGLLLVAAYLASRYVHVHIGKIFGVHYHEIGLLEKKVRTMPYTLLVV